jgi:APA family basic amino acid/polyamine antiporter
MKHQNLKRIKRTLSSRSLVAWVGAIIGAGLFSLTGIAAAEHAVRLLHFLFLAAVGCAFAGLCYADLHL